MVGVAGRSKGCNTCRKRKIGCGLQRPQCAQCIRSNRVCTGYVRETIFIVNGDQKASFRADEAEKQAKNKRLTKSDRAEVVTTPAWKKTKFYLGIEVCPVPAHRDQLFDAFIRGHIPFEELGMSGKGTWLHQIALLPDKLPVLTTAILCLSAARLGRRKEHQALVRESLSLYAKGLWQLQKALWNPNQMYSDEILSACILLSMYELYECPNSDRGGYISHCNGSARLVELRGPAAHQTGFGHMVFLAFRTQQILQALECHKPTFLAESSWTSTPWQKQPKDIGDKLMDCVAQAAWIFSITDHLDGMTPTAAVSMVLTVIDVCWDMDSRMRDLYRELEESIPGPLYWPTLSTLSNAADNEIEGKVFPVTFEFFNLRMAMVSMLYWAIQTMLRNGLQLLYGVLQQVPVSRHGALGVENPHPLLLECLPVCGSNCVCNGLSCIAMVDIRKLPLLGPNTDMRIPVRNVCQSVEYCLKPCMLDFGRTSIIAPLSIVLDTIKGYTSYSREAAWATNVLLDVEEIMPYMRMVRKFKDSTANQ